MKVIDDDDGDGDDFDDDERKKSKKTNFSSNDRSGHDDQNAYCTESSKTEPSSRGKRPFKVWLFAEPITN